MTQEALDQLVIDAANEFIYNDMYELAQFFGYLAGKYNLDFDSSRLGLDNYILMKKD